MAQIWVIGHSGINNRMLRCFGLQGGSLAEVLDRRHTLSSSSSLSLHSGSAEHLSADLASRLSLVAPSLPSHSPSARYV